MNILSIDTSTKNLSLAVSRDENVLRFCNVKLARPLSSSIMPSIKKILEGAKVPLKKIDGFAVGLGPGSFTSLRVGLSTIKGLAFATNKPAVGISSLDVLAMNVRDDAQVCVLCDAKRNMVYACVYEKNGTSLKRKGEYSLAGIEDVLKQVKGATVFIGDGVQLYKDNITKAKGVEPVFADEKKIFPQAKALSQLALPLFHQKKFEDIDKLIPLYLYPDHCQIQKKVKSKK